MEMISLENDPVSLTLDHPSQVSEVRRLATSLARRLGFEAEDQGRVALVVTEAANNAVLHGGGGQILLRSMAHQGPAIEALIVDKGPGIADLSRALRDGYSTAGTPGTGLGAMARLADKFDIYSAVGGGTAVLVQLWPRRSNDPREAGETGEALEIGTVCLPKAGEIVCGDACAVESSGDRVVLIVADGLGHGPDAAVASTQAINVFHKALALPPADILAEIHASLRSTRGAAVAVTSLDRSTREIRFAGVGNIAASIVSRDETRSMVSYNGTLGHEVRKIQEFQYEWPSGALVIMQSDGLQTHWRLDRYPGLTARTPGLIAGILYRDFSRGRDDVTVLAVREGQVNGAR